MCKIIKILSLVVFHFATYGMKCDYYAFRDNSTACSYEIVKETAEFTKERVEEYLKFLYDAKHSTASEISERYKNLKFDELINEHLSLETYYPKVKAFRDSCNAIYNEEGRPILQKQAVSMLLYGVLTMLTNNIKAASGI
jgi:hypothetical protein